MTNEYITSKKIQGGYSITPPERISTPNKVGLCIDWFSGSFDFYQHEGRNAIPESNEKTRYLKGYEKLMKLFNLLTYSNYDEIVYDEKAKGLYTGGSYELGEEIKIFINGPKNSNDLHTNLIQMSGKACRDFEARGGSFLDLWKFLTLENANFTRVDGAIDVFTNEYFDIDKIGRYKYKGWYASPSSKGSYMNNTGTHGVVLEGEGHYFGSLESDTYVLIYDKKLERYSKDIQTFVKHWFRVEMRLKHDRADWFIYNFIKHAESDHDYSFIKEALYKYLKFKVPVKTSNATGKNYITKSVTVRHWNDAKWWIRFLDITKEAKFYDANLDELSIERNKRHIKHSASKIIARLFFTNPNDLYPFIIRMAYKATPELKESDFIAINTYLRKINEKELTKEDIQERKKYLIALMKGLNEEMDYYSLDEKES